MPLLSDRFVEACSLTPKRPAFLDPRGHVLTFEQFLYTVLSFAEQLADRGVARGHVVCVLIADPVAAIAFRLAALRLGCTLLSVAPEAAVKDDPVKIDWIISAREARIGAEKEILFDQSWVRPPTRLVPAAPGGRLVRATSGTTGLPKLRVTSEETVLRRIERSLAFRQAPAGAAYVGLSLMSGIGFNAALRVLLSGHLLLPKGPDIATDLKVMDQHGATAMYLPAGQLPRIVAAARSAEIVPMRIQRIQAGGSAISVEIAREAEAIFDCEVVNSYGSTETNSLAHVRVTAHPDVEGVVGRFYPDIAVEFRDENGARTDPETGGHLYVRPAPGTEALNYPDEAPLCDADGWIKTGDIGHIIEDGLFVLSGRETDFLNLGGNKIAPSEIEKYARKHPSVREVAAFRVRGAAGIDEIGLAVVLSDPDAAKELPAVVAAQMVREYDFHIVPLDSIPLTPQGKTDRRGLTALVEAARNTPELETQS